MQNTLLVKFLGVKLTVVLFPYYISVAIDVVLSSHILCTLTSSSNLQWLCRLDYQVTRCFT
jgi:hypothetical protein